MAAASAGGDLTALEQQNGYLTLWNEMTNRLDNEIPPRIFYQTHQVEVDEMTRLVCHV